MKKEDFYNIAKKKFIEITEFEPSSHWSQDLVKRYIKHLLFTLDLLLEGTFYSALITKKLKNLVDLAVDLSDWLNLPSGSEQGLKMLELMRTN